MYWPMLHAPNWARPLRQTAGPSRSSKRAPASSLIEFGGHHSGHSLKQCRRVGPERETSRRTKLVNEGASPEVAALYGLAGVAGAMLSFSRRDL
jgi:hypothetical protein